MSELNVDEISQNIAEKFVQKLKDNGVFIGRWIPVSERLPEKNGWYQCTVTENDVSWTMDLFYKNGKWLDNRRIGMFNMYGMYGYGCAKEKHRLSYQELISEFDWTENVIAWMSLSKPYELQKSEEE